MNVTFKNIEGLLKQICQTIIKKEISNLKFDKTYIGVIVSITDNKAIVKINGDECVCRIKDGITIAIGNVVIVKVPNNNFSKKYIDGKLL